MPIKIGDITLYSVEDLSELLAIQETTLRKYLREGKLKGRKMAKRWYVSEESLADYFRETEPGSRPEKA